VIKVVVQSAKLLSGQEDSKASKHSLELELVEYLVSILIVGLINEKAKRTKVMI